MSTDQWIGVATVALGVVYLCVGVAFVVRWLTRSGRAGSPVTAPYGLPVVTFFSGAVALIFSGQSVSAGSLPGWGGAVIIALMLVIGIAPLVVALRARGRRHSEDTW